MEPISHLLEIPIPPNSNSVGSIKSPYDELSQSHLEYAADFDVAFKK